MPTSSACASSWARVQRARELPAGSAWYSRMPNSRPCTTQNRPRPSSRSSCTRRGWATTMKMASGTSSRRASTSRAVADLPSSRVRLPGVSASFIGTRTTRLMDGLPSAIRGTALLPASSRSMNVAVRCQRPTLLVVGRMGTPTPHLAALLRYNQPPESVPSRPRGETARATPLRAGANSDNDTFNCCSTSRTLSVSERSLRTRAMDDWHGGFLRQRVHQRL
jgi:hypothetical protein